ncbi:MAG: AbrB/MazE/SpoVT family DNA-binding domain-containing protein [Thaumarchaeota archaeon]|nr:AbrB/MazE/SpoVT family DNA-binding domain-containing protein [Nitrososphaerota archaeon]
MAEEEEPEIAVVGAKGQIVIPQRLRKDLKITPKTKLVIYRKNDKLVVTKLKVPSLEEDLKELFKEIDQGYKDKKEKKPGEKEILEEIQAYRKEKRANQGA